MLIAQCYVRFFPMRTVSSVYRMCNPINFHSLSPSLSFCAYVCVCTAYDLLSIQYAIICWCALLNFNEKKMEREKVALNAQTHIVCSFMNFLLFSFFFIAFVFVAIYFTHRPKWHTQRGSMYLFQFRLCLYLFYFFV